VFSIEDTNIFMDEKLETYVEAIQYNVLGLELIV
jgi:hypothetical protein